MVVLLVYDDWLLWMFIIIAFDGCFLWLFILINVFDCLIVYWLLIITYLSWFLALSVFNFLDISKFLHWVYFGFGSLYFCFRLAIYFFFGYFSMNALVIYKYCFGLSLFGMLSTSLIPVWMIGCYVNDCFYSSAFVFLMLPKGERIM